MLIEAYPVEQSPFYMYTIIVIEHLVECDQALYETKTKSAFNLLSIIVIWNRSNSGAHDDQFVEITLDGIISTP